MASCISAALGGLVLDQCGGEASRSRVQARLESPAVIACQGLAMVPMEKGPTVSPGDLGSGPHFETSCFNSRVASLCSLGHSSHVTQLLILLLSGLEGETRGQGPGEHQDSIQGLLRCSQSPLAGAGTGLGWECDVRSLTDSCPHWRGRSSGFRETVAW